MTPVIDVQFVGSGDAFGSGGRLQTCICVNADTVRFLLDCGASSLSGLKGWGISPNSIDVILLSHLHGDHFGGVPFFILDAHLVSKRTKPLIVAGPPGVRERIRAAQEVLFPGSSELRLQFPLDYSEWADNQLTEIADLAVTPNPVGHPSGAPAYALRVESHGKILAYSGDTEWTNVLVSTANDADLFICEAYTFAKIVKFHLSYRTVMAHRNMLNCKRMILTHMSDDLLSHLDEVGVPCAEDGGHVIL